MEYQYVATRPGGWDAEERAVGRAAEKHSKDAAKAVSKASLALERGVNKVQAFALKHSKRAAAGAPCLYVCVCVCVCVCVRVCARALGGDRASACVCSIPCVQACVLNI